MSEAYELYCKIVEVAYEMAEDYIDNSDKASGNILCSEKGLKLIQDRFESVKDEYKEVVFKQFLEELQEREIAYDATQFYAKAN